MKRTLDVTAITIHNSPKKPRTPSKNCSDGATISKAIEILTDVYCWECHKECVESALDCFYCPRTFHTSCITNDDSNKKSSDDTVWKCPVCVKIESSCNKKTMSLATKLLSPQELKTVLSYALKRMKHPESLPFQSPVPKSQLPDYYDIIFHPMDLSTIEKNLNMGQYTSTTMFLEDTKWISHNCIIYNWSSSKYAADSKLIVKICKHEMSEIELCPDCFLKSCLREDQWFTEPCTFPHTLVWAKLKGFPYWPAKVLRISANGTVDVRFFGAHDRAWIPMNQIYLLSQEAPIVLKNIKKHGFDKALEELHLHIQKLRQLPDMDFKYADSKEHFKSAHLDNCAKMFGEKFVKKYDAKVQNNSFATKNDSCCQESTVFNTSQTNTRPTEVSLTETPDKSTPSDLGLFDKMQATSFEKISEPITVEKSSLQLNNVNTKKVNGINIAWPLDEQSFQSTNCNTENEEDQSQQTISDDDQERLKFSPSTNNDYEDQANLSVEQIDVKRPDNVSSSSLQCTEKRDSSQQHNIVKKQTLQTILARMSKATETISGKNDCTEKPNKKRLIQNVDIDVEKEKLIETETGCNKAAVLDKYMEKIKTFLSETLCELIDDTVKNGAIGPSVTTENRDTGKSQQKSYDEVLSSMKASSQLALEEANKLQLLKYKTSIDVLKEVHEKEKALAIKEAKSKQWCAQCDKEAVFYCCWNTSYCDYPCQQLHWPKHQNTCAQVRSAPSADYGSHAHSSNFNTWGSAPPNVSIHPSGEGCVGHGQGGGPPGNVVPIYAMAAGGFYRTASLDLNGGAAGSSQQLSQQQYLAIARPHMRPPLGMPTFANSQQLSMARGPIGRPRM